MHVGSSIKRLRKNKGINGVDFSAMCGITQTTLSLIETGAKSAHPKTIQNICKQLGTTEYFLHISSIEIEDLPAANRKRYEKIFPHIKSILIELFSND